MSEPESEALYRIVDGVHRCVAAQLSGLPWILARVDVKGSLGPEQNIPLSVIYSPKSEISRWDRNRDFQDLLKIMEQDTDRTMLPPVILTVVSARVAKYLTPVSQVVVRPV